MPFELEYTGQVSVSACECEIIMSNLQWQRELASADTILFEQWPTKPISTNIMQITHRIMQHFKHYTQLRFMVNNI